MTNQQQPQFTIAELGAKFGAQQGQTFSELITLEKAIEALQVQIQDMSKTETRLVDNIQDLEDEISNLRAENFELKQQMAGSDERIMTPKLTAIAQAAKGIIDNKKAAPV